jgi:hypothetical protein
VVFAAKIMFRIFVIAANIVNEAIQPILAACCKAGLLRRFAPRNGGGMS